MVFKCQAIREYWIGGRDPIFHRSSQQTADAQSPGSKRHKDLVVNLSDIPCQPYTDPVGLIKYMISQRVPACLPVENGPCMSLQIQITFSAYYRNVSNTSASNGAGESFTTSNRRIGTPASLLTLASLVNSRWSGTQGNGR